MKYIALIWIIVLASCRNADIVKEKDYSCYLKPGVIQKEEKKALAELRFWNTRLRRDSGNFVDMLEMAKSHLSLFKLTGDLKDLYKGDSLLKASSEKLRNTNPGILYSLSQTAITQHQFKQAAYYNESAMKADGDLYTIHLLNFDVSMELGNYDEAWKNLQAIRNDHSFDYLIRRAKWQDHHGDQDGAIKLMQEAFESIQEKKQSLYCWTLSNLADMYGHAGRVEEAYKACLQVLKKDPGNLYCLKGIAWIAYSHDKNYAVAKKILEFIQSQTSMPDLDLMLAEIEESAGNIAGKKRHIQRFVSIVSGSTYGNMYNKYLIKIYADDPQQTKKAVELAKKEIGNRFTPETCDWLSWAYYKNGDIQKALDIAGKYVYRINHEPSAMMHTGLIFLDAGRKKEAKELLKECLNSSFELGPVKTKFATEALKH